ncbi:MAG: DUF3352 domain-containing protein [Candidatus Micrarchaeia archaeon]
MRKLAIVALLLLLGCVTLPWETQKDELEMVPNSANALIIFRPSSLLNDSDFIALYNSSEEMQLEIKRIEATTGINPTNVERIVLFFKFDSLEQESETYGGFIARGKIEKEKILDSMKLNNLINELKYNNQIIYEVTSKEAPENKTYFSFLQNFLVGGSKEAVEDSVDLVNGKGESIKARSSLKRVYEKLDEKAVFMLLFENTEAIRRELNSSDGSFGVAAFSKTKSTGFSISKEGRKINFKAIILADDAPSANDISKLIESSLSLARGISPAESTLADVLGKIKVETHTEEIWVKLETNLDEIEKLNKELDELYQET